jgi:Stage II sporulation protein E (SpoIIE)
MVNAVAMGVGVEFLWTVQGFGDRIFRAASHLCWIGLAIAGTFSLTRMQPGEPVFVGMLAENWFLFAYNVITGGADLVALMGRGRNRSVAAAMLLIPVGYFLGIAGHPISFRWPGLNFFTAAFYLSDVFIAVLLMRQTWTAWRKAEDLRVEFAAAREVQQQLVPVALPAITGWRVEAAYLPAAEVGGDFYHVIEQPGAAMLLIGDVSGKGLKAAMTGLLTIGAASALAAECPAPALLLARLNREMVRLQMGGFITCLCARMAADGAITLANAGHLSPYRNGEEVPLESSLPLGIALDAAYAESTVRLAPGDTLTFLSDGVVEAQSPTGELFGFDRTAAISTQSAESIAQAAQAFGQEDDITVLSLTFTPAEVLHV